MSNSNSQIQTPIDWSDPYEATRTGTGGMAYDIGTINSNPEGKTNKWAFDKPVRFDKPGELTDAERRSVLYGLVRPKLSAMNYTTASDWTYEPPTDTDWQRSTDWEGYRHDAVPGIRSCAWPASLTVDMVCNIPRPTGVDMTGSIPADHLRRMKNASGAWVLMHWGVGFRFKSNDGWHCKTVDDTGAESFALKVADIPGWDQEEYTSARIELCVFLSETKLEQWTGVNGVSAASAIIPFPKYSPEYRFKTYSGTALKYRYAPKRRALTAYGRYSGATHHTYAQLLAHQPVSLWLAIADNPYSDSPSHHIDASHRIKVVYSLWTYHSGLNPSEGAKKELILNLPGSTGTANCELVADVTSGGTAMGIYKVTIPAGAMIDESLKNLNANGVTMPVAVWEEITVDNGQKEWRNITDWADSDNGSDVPCVVYDGVH